MGISGDDPVRARFDVDDEELGDRAVVDGATAAVVVVVAAIGIAKHSVVCRDT